MSDSPAVVLRQAAAQLDERTRHRWWVERWEDSDGWAPRSSSSTSREEAETKQAGLARKYPAMPTRITRETTTWSLEDSDA